MPEIYCGTSNILPAGFNRLGNSLECLQKGFGACRYTGKLGSKHAQSLPLDPTRPRKFCGLGPLPPGFPTRGNRFECLKKGYGTCLYKDPNSVNIVVPPVVNNNPIVPVIIANNNGWAFIKNIWFWIAVFLLLMLIIWMIWYFL
jgi:hypothetical protein